jgi:hypothetical protein
VPPPDLAYRRNSIVSIDTPLHPPQGYGSPSMAHESSSSRAHEGHAGRQAKPKRLKAHTVTTKSFNIPTVPRDDYGRPQLPLRVGVMEVRKLGTICMREHFHTERYIFPVGYEVIRFVISPPLLPPYIAY